MTAPDDNDDSKRAEDSKQLEYWHSTDPAPTPTVLLVLALLAGTAIGGFFTLIAIAVFVGGISGRAGRPFLGLAAMVLLAVGVVCFARFADHQRRARRRAMDPDLPRRPGRFFALGTLLGCGLAALLAGVCFGIGALSR